MKEELQPQSIPDSNSQKWTLATNMLLKAKYYLHQYMKLVL